MLKVKRGQGGSAPQQRECSWLCGSPVATPAVHMRIVPHCTVMPTRLLALRSWAVPVGVWAILVGVWAILLGVWAILLGVWAILVGVRAILVGFRAILVGVWAILVGVWAILVGVWAILVGVWAILVGIWEDCEPLCTAMCTAPCIRWRESWLPDPDPSNGAKIISIPASSAPRSPPTKRPSAGLGAQDMFRRAEHIWRPRSVS